MFYLRFDIYSNEPGGIGRKFSCKNLDRTLNNNDYGCSNFPVNKLEQFFLKSS